MLSSVLMQLVTVAAPYLIVYAAGAVLAAKRMQRHPGPSRLALLACVLLFAGSLTAHSLFGYFHYKSFNHPEYKSDGEFFAHYGWILRQGSAVAIVAFVAGMALLMKAVYAEREGAGLTDESAAPPSPSQALPSPPAPVPEPRPAPAA